MYKLVTMADFLNADTLKETEYESYIELQSAYYRATSSGSGFEYVGMKARGKFVREYWCW